MVAYADDDELATSTVPPLQGVALEYKSSLDSLMSYFHGVDNGKEGQYTKGELRALTPDDVVAWMNVKTFDDPDPPLDANPTECRSSSLEFWKKALSFFMPDRLTAWVSGRNEGNPTRSIEVNSLIRRVKKKEVRKQGKASQVKRPLTREEFQKMQHVFQSNDSFLWKYGLSCLTKFQFHMIGRIDDTTQVLIENIQVHDFYPNALKTRMNWSKNVSEERDAPWQIVLGAMDTTYCVLTCLSLWLELHARLNPNVLLSPYVFAFTNDNTVPGGGKKSKEIASTAFTKVFRMDEFAGGVVNGSIGGKLGSHSIRKFASTHVRRSGINKDDKDIRGRWKLAKRVSDVYDDVELPFPDAKVADKLCIGGPCYYLFPDELLATTAAVGDGTGDTSLTPVLKTFILSNVVPNIRKVLSEDASLVLGKAMLWMIYSPFDAANEIVPKLIKDQIQLEWNEIVLALDPGIDCNSPFYNPIQRVPVVITGDEGCVNIDIIPSLDENGNVVDGMGGVVGIANGGTGGREVGGMASTAGGLAAQLLAVQSLASQIRREIQELRSNQMADRVETRKGFTMVNTNIRRIALQPGLRGPVGTVAQGGTRATGGNDDDMAVDAVATLNGVGAAPAVLSPTPRNLFELWQEYQVGIGGRKAARLFTSRERGGKSKYKYHRRLVIWRVISGLVRGGMTADAAIDSIYAIYGHQTNVTIIINRIRKQKNDGTLNPNLRI